MEGSATLNITDASSGSLSATGGDYAAGIGGGQNGACGAITISGGTVTATGGGSARALSATPTYTHYPHPRRVNFTVFPSRQALTKPMQHQKHLVKIMSQG